MKILQNGRLVRFSKRTDCWCVFSWNMYNQNGQFSVSTAAVFKVVTAYIDHGKMSSVKRTSGWKPKLSERDRHTLKRIVPKNQNCHSKGDTRNQYSTWEDPVSTKNSPTSASQIQYPWWPAIVKTLITENNTKRWKRWHDNHKTRTSDN
jgi:hypothetical protein